VSREEFGLIRHPWGRFRLLGPGPHAKPPWPGGAVLSFAPPRDWKAIPPSPEQHQEVLERVQAYQTASRILNVPARTLLLSAALMIGMTFLEPGYWQFLGMLGLAVAALLSHLALFWILARQWKKVRQSDRGVALAVTAVSPWASVRAPDRLGKGLLDGFHPAAVAQALFEGREWTNFVAARLRESAFVPEGETDGSRAWNAWALQLGFDPRALLAPPEREDHSASYCPRCLAQFKVSRELCSDCGVPLTAFEPDSRAPNGG
jgi:hypothetical protein